MSHHPIVGFGFLALVLGGIGFGAAKGVEGSRAWVAEEEAAAEARRVAEEEAHKRAEEDIRDARIQTTIRAAVYAAQADNFDEAIKILTAAAAEYGNVTAIWLNLGIAQRGAEKWDDADVSFQKVLAMDAEDWDAIAERGTIKKVKGDVDGALALLEQIPAGEGRMIERLVYDPTFADLDKNERFQKLLDKHEARALRMSISQQGPEPDQKQK